ncbi:MAG: hypothetical protein ACNFW9_00150 [Candidatus Kerfeldbacteria bacterium]
MSTNNIFYTFQSKNKKIAYFSLFALILIVIGIASFNIGKKQSTDNKTPLPIVDISKVPSYSENPQILGQQIYNWTGKISEIKDSNITIDATLKDFDGKFISKKISAIINDDTIINMWDLTLPPSTTEKSNKSLITYNNLSTGQEIIIKSNNNINQNNEVIADTITLLITP